ncbi:MAG: penicillin-binding protein activator [Rhodospirillales bacterium]|nr:penicillin-binding protein activator [Rhodospirillales bacterium]
MSSLLAVSLALASCDTLRSATGLPSGAARPQSGEVVASPTPEAKKPGLSATVPPAAEPAAPGAPPFTAELPQDQPVKVALLLPLSGRLAKLGKAMSDAAQMAMFDLADRRFELMPIDDKGTPGGAADAAKQAAANGAQLILGPLLASSVRAVVPIAASANVPVVAFSSDRNVAQPGVYIIGFTPEAEVQRVISYATLKGLNRFAALVPDNLYGSAIADALRKSAAASGGAVVRIESYDPDTQDFSALMRKLTGASDAPAGDAQPSMAMLPPLPAFDALLLAEGGPQLRAMAASLAAFGIRSPGVQLLGTGKWDEPGLGSETALVGAWYAAPPPSLREEFDVRYKRAFGQPPPRLATLAYDATALAAVLARGPERTPFSPAHLTDPNGFFGRDGLFRLTVDGVVDRRLAILRVERNGVDVIDEAPRSFAAGS